MLGEPPTRGISVVDKTKSGIPGLDDALHGGFPTGSVILVSGGPGTGKSILMNQFLVKGATEYKEPGVLVSMEESLDSTNRNMRQFGWDLKDLVTKGLLALVDASPMIQNDRVVLRPEHPVLGREEFSMESLLSLIHREIRKIKAKRVAIDSISTLTLQHKDLFRIRHDLLNLVRSIRITNATCLVAVESPTDESIGRFDVEGFLMDGVITLRLVRQGNVRIRTIEITKMRGSIHQMNPLLLMIDDKGIQVSDLPPIQ
ncbi:MAG: ATPase domain-containing protein [Candidatus Hodarchaeota archaeon]